MALQGLSVRDSREESVNYMSHLPGLPDLSCSVYLTAKYLGFCGGSFECQNVCHEIRLFFASCEVQSRFAGNAYIDALCRNRD